MSNFLQRVAATVIQPKARLQPMFGSIFAPATLPSPAEFFPAQAEISSQTIASHRHERMTAPHSDTSSQALASHAFETQDRLFPTNPHEDSSLSRLNRSSTTDQPLLPAYDDFRGPSHRHQFAEDPAFEFSKSANANQLASSDPYQPLIAASQQTAPKLHPRESPPTPTAARTRGAEAGRRAQSAQREADEIHIHIGRIEVAAIAQPAPRPAAAAARRSLNLDEYLGRGNGRRG